MRIVIDVSTALQWRNRPAVGIVRTEREIARYFLLNKNDVALIQFDREDGNFRRVTKTEVESLFPEIPLSIIANNKNLFEFKALYNFFDADVLISSGLQWDIDFLSSVYEKKRNKNFKVVQIIYDIIPILMPEYCVPGMDVLFPKFIMDTAWTADVIYAISESTKNDFESFLKSLQIEHLPSVRLIQLGCDIPPSVTKSKEVIDLQKNEFILYVSTIEPRKNHKMIFDIWRDLESRMKESTPRLVLVGNKGWNTENLITSFTNCARLFPHKINILNELNDTDLEWLYTNAMFTIYPSLYEGWGLPIAESLARGTPCIASNTSSMPEVSGQFCELIDPYDFISWRDKIIEYITDRGRVESRRENIKQNYQIVTWSNAMAQFQADLHAVCAQWEA